MFGLLKRKKSRTPVSFAGSETRAVKVMDEGSQPPHLIELPEIRISEKPIYGVVRRAPGSLREMVGDPEAAGVGVAVAGISVNVGVNVNPPPIRVGVPV